MAESPKERPTVCGFSFGRNLSNLNYPVEESVRSILPLCERFVFAVGNSDDDSRDRIAAIGSQTDVPIEIVDTEWPEVHSGGRALAVEANKAMAAAEATGCDWGFYIQADEVIHEQDIPLIQDAMARWVGERRVKALLFNYLHFVMDYQTIDPWMYHKASRVIRLDKSCHIVGDACGPEILGYTGTVHGGNGYLDKHHLGGHVQWAAGGQTDRKARVFHYGWVKSREELEDKMGMIEQFWWGSIDAQQVQKLRADKFGNLIDRYPILKKYGDSHPAVMAQRIADHETFAAVSSRWLNPRFYAEVLRHGFHG